MLIGSAGDNFYLKPIGGLTKNSLVLTWLNWLNLTWKSCKILGIVWNF